MSDEGGLMKVALAKSFCSMIAIALLSCAGSTVPRSHIERMTAYSLGWQDHYSLDMSPRRMLESRDAGVKDVDDPQIMRGIETAINEIADRSGRDEGPIDGRLFCLLYRENRSVDTLVLNRFDMEYNGNVYDLDIELLRLIGTSQSSEYRAMIEDSIKNLRRDDEE